MTPDELRQIAAKLEAGEKITQLEQFQGLQSITGWESHSWVFKERTIQNFIAVKGNPFANTDAAIDLVRECFPGVPHGLHTSFMTTGSYIASVGKWSCVAPTPAASIMAAACRAKAEQMEQGQ